MSPRAVNVMRYVLPAVIGTVAGMWLERYVWKGRY